MDKNTKAKKVRVRGTGTFDPETQKFGFEPFNEAPSTQANVKTCAGGGKSWTTTGSDPSRMICLKTKAGNPDLYADVLEQFNKLTADLKPSHPLPMPDEQRVVSEDGMQCWLNEATGTLTFTGTVSIQHHPHDWQAEVLRQVQLVVRRLPASEKFNKIINHLIKNKK